MQHEHLIQVNDLNAPHLEQLTRNQLWQGLVLRACEPQRFMEQLDEVIIIERSEHALKREMHFGALVVVDHITLEHEHAVHYHTQPGEQHGGGTLRMQIEEPEAGALFVRFSYDTPHEVAPDETHLLGYLRQAWQDSDLATVMLIRQLAAEGLLG